VGNWNLHLIEQAFAKAATDFNEWGNALATLVAETNGYGAVLLNTGSRAIPGTPMTDSLQAGSEVYFRDGWYLRDERFRGVPTLMRDGVCDDLDVMDADSIKRHPYYQEFLAPLGLSSFAGIRVAAGDDLWCISLQRKATDERFSPNEKSKLATLSNSLSSFAAVSRALGFAASNAALEAFEIGGSAVLLINERGEVIRATAAAERLLRGGIRIVRKRLVSVDIDSTMALDRALHNLLWTRSEAALSPPVALWREAAMPLLAYPLKLANLASNPFAEGRALIVLVDPGRRSRPPEETLRGVFKLTTAEARLAARLAAGAELNDISQELGIAKETGRHHLKSIFTKTHVRRQAELVALLAGLLARTDVD